MSADLSSLFRPGPGVTLSLAPASLEQYRNVDSTFSACAAILAAPDCLYASVSGMVTCLVDICPLPGRGLKMSGFSTSG